MPSHSVRGLLIGLAVCACVGAGCPLSKQTAPAAPKVNVNQMRQPAPAAAPSKEPVIPPEAANVPRPY